MNITIDNTIAITECIMSISRVPESQITDADYSLINDFLVDDGSDVESLDDFEDTSESRRIQNHIWQYREADMSSSDGGASISNSDSDDHMLMDYQNDVATSNEVSEVVSSFDDIEMLDADSDSSSNSHDDDPILHSHDVSMTSNNNIAAHQTTTQLHQTHVDSPNLAAIDQDMQQFISHFLTLAPDTATVGDYRRLTQFADSAAQWAFENATSFIVGWRHLDTQATRVGDESFRRLQVFLGLRFSASNLSNQSSGDRMDIGTSREQTSQDMIMSDVDDDN